MPRQDILSILITFTVGLVAGGYLYLTGFVPTVARIEVPAVVKVDEFVVVSEVYGSCGDDCPSFQVLSDGSYRYFYSTPLSDEQILQTGDLPSGLRRDLQRTLLAQQLEAQSQETTPALCDSFSDGIDVSYVVTLNTQEYQLNTCGTAVDVDTAMWQNLDRVWGYLESAGNTSG